MISEKKKIVKLANLGELVVQFSLLEASASEGLDVVIHVVKIVVYLLDLKKWSCKNPCFNLSLNLRTTSSSLKFQSFGEEIAKNTTEDKEIHYGIFGKKKSRQDLQGVPKKLPFWERP